MLAFLANLVTENRFFWFFPVAIALIAVFAAEVFCIVWLIRKILSAKKNDPQQKNNEGGVGFSSVAILLVTESGIRAREGWLIALGILALVGAVALAALVIICYAKGILFAKAEKQPVKKINVFDMMPSKKDKKEEKKTPAPVTDPKQDLHSAMFAFDDSEPYVSDEPKVIPAAAYIPPVYVADDEEEDSDEDSIDDIQSLDEDADEEEAEIADPSEDPAFFTGNERVVGYDPATDCNIVERYRKSFLAKLIQSESYVKQYYSALKNALLSYKGTKSRVSWTADSFHNGRMQIAKINVKTRILELYLAIDPASLEGSVYRGQDVRELRKYAETPYRYKIRSPRKFKWAMELVQRVSEEHGLSPIDIEWVDYESQYPFDSMDNLVKRKLVKVTRRLEKAPSEFEYDNTAAPAEEEQPYLPEEPETQGNWELDDEQPLPEVAPEEEQAPAYEQTPYGDAPVYEEPAPEEAIPAAAPAEESRPTWGDQISLNEQEPDVFFEEKQVGAEFAPKGKKENADLAQVDVALLDLHFKNGDVVTLDILKRRGLVFSDAQRLKVRASGGMKTQLTIIANQFTYDAINAINKAGGTPQFLK